MAGKEVSALQHALDTLIPRNRHLALDGGVDFIDSSGLGLLVRYLVRAKHGAGTLSVCAVSPKIDEVLRITKLKGVFPLVRNGSRRRSRRRIARTRSRTPARRRSLASTRPRTSRRICGSCCCPGTAASSGYNLPDALILLVATQPTVVVVSAELQAAAGTRAADEFHRLSAARAVVTLPPGFSGHDAAEASDEVLRAVGAHVGRTA